MNRNQVTTNKKQRALFDKLVATLSSRQFIIKGFEFIKADSDLVLYEKNGLIMPIESLLCANHDNKGWYTYTTHGAITDIEVGFVTEISENKIELSTNAGNLIIEL